MKPQKQEVRQMPEQNENSKPVSYSVHLGLKTPSRYVQYRMLDASVTVTGEDLDDVTRKASDSLVMAVVRVANLFKEAPPDEICDEVEALYGEEEAAKIYDDSVAKSFS